MWPARMRRNWRERCRRLLSGSTSDLGRARHRLDMDSGSSGDEAAEKGFLPCSEEKSGRASTRPDPGRLPAGSAYAPTVGFFSVSPNLDRPRPRRLRRFIPAKRRSSRPCPRARDCGKRASRAPVTAGAVPISKSLRAYDVHFGRSQRGGRGRDWPQRFCLRMHGQPASWARMPRSRVPGQVRSITVAPGAFSFTDSMPFSLAVVEEYISLVPITCPFVAVSVK